MPVRSGSGAPSASDDGGEPVRGIRTTWFEGEPSPPTVWYAYSQVVPASSCRARPSSPPSPSGVVPGTRPSACEVATGDAVPSADRCSTVASSRSESSQPRPAPSSAGGSGTRLHGSGRSVVSGTGVPGTPLGSGGGPDVVLVEGEGCAVPAVAVGVTPVPTRSGPDDVQPATAAAATSRAAVRRTRVRGTRSVCGTMWA